MVTANHSSVATRIGFLPACKKLKSINCKILLTDCNSADAILYVEISNFELHFYYLSVGTITVHSPSKVGINAKEGHEDMPVNCYLGANMMVTK